MKNYLLPIYHSKLKPWIKWWLLKQLELRSKTLSDWIEGTTPITITGAFKGKIQNLELEGNTSQTGTPSPEAPIPVQVVKGHNVIKINTTEYPLDLKSKNLFDKTTSATDKRISTGTGGTYSSSGYSISNFIPILPNTNYIVNTVSYRAYFCWYDKNHIYISGTDIGDGTSRKSPSNAQYIKFDFKTDEINTIQLEEGEAATTYEPYYDYELCKIGDDYSDYILPDNNGYKILKNVGKVVLNGSESTWLENSGIRGLFQVTLTNVYNNNDSINAMSNLLQGNTGTNIALTTGYTDNSISTYSSNRLFFRLNSYANNLSGLKTFLSTNNLVAYYIQATPTYETITNTNLISQLDAIYNAEFKNGTNTITQTNSDLPFILHFKYYKKG